MQVLYRVLPRGRHVVVHGFPTTEGNVVELVRVMQRRLPAPIVWLDGPDEQTLRAVGLTSEHLISLPMNSMAGALRFLTAKATFFTHGLYWSIRPPKKKPLINLWHGDGPKSHAGQSTTSTYEVSGSGEFGAYRADFHGVPRENLILTGNPRIAQLRRPTPRERLSSLGLDPERPYVVHMPTYRRSIPVAGTSGWKDFVDDDPGRGLLARTDRLATTLDARNIQLVLKRHPLDADSTDHGIRSVTDDELLAAGTTLYEFLGGSAGLLTDYSSVWTDYLCLDRPIAFLTPDIDGYEATRGLHPADLVEHLPGRQLETVADDDAFASEIVTGAPSTSQLRLGAIARFALVHPESPGDDLFDDLITRGIL